MSNRRIGLSGTLLSGWVFWMAEAVLPWPNWKPKVLKKDIYT